MISPACSAQLQCKCETLQKIFASAERAEVPPRDVQLARAFGKASAAGATTGRAREAIVGGETSRVFTSTRGALRLHAGRAQVRCALGRASREGARFPDLVGDVG
jgi:hypothetical protein